MGRLPWLPPLLALALLAGVVVNANLGHPLPFELDGAGRRSGALVAFVSASLYYAVLLLVLRRRLPAAAPRAGAAAGATALLALALGAAGELPGGGLLRFTWKDLLFDFPGYAALSFADGLVLWSPRDPERCDPLAWERASAPPLQHVEWAARTPGGRVLLVTRSEVARGMFEPLVYRSLVALAPDGALDRGFAERFHRCVEGRPFADGESVALVEGGDVSAVVLPDGGLLPRDALEARAAALRAFGAEELEALGEGELLATRPAQGGGVLAATFSLGGPRLVRTATFALGPRFADEDEWRSVARAGGELLVVWHGRRPPRSHAGEQGRPPIEALLGEDVQLLGADGRPDPAFRLALPRALAELLDGAWSETHGVWDVGGGRFLLELDAGARTVLVPVDLGGVVGTDPWIELDGAVAAVRRLDDGRLAVVHLLAEGGRSRVSLVPARGRHALAAPPRDAPGAPADGGAVALAMSGTLLHVGRDGRMLLVGGGPPGGLRLVDGRGAPVGGFRPPPFLRLDD